MVLGLMSMIHISLYLYILDRWRLQATDVCFEAKGNKFGTFTMNYNGQLTAIRLVHKSGLVGCSGGIRSKWGCAHETSISIVISDDNNTIIFPKNLPLDSWFSLKPYMANSRELIFGIPVKPTYVTVGKIMRLWYGEDFRDYTEINNVGRVCADVYSEITGMYLFPYAYVTAKRTPCITDTLYNGHPV